MKRGYERKEKKKRKEKEKKEKKKQENPIKRKISSNHIV
jgi:hypothetical protein